MTSWLITSFGLPVATATGRLVAATSTGLSRHLLSTIMAVLMVTVGVASWRVHLFRRHRRALRRASTS
jgi:hypothetical protein